MAEAQTTVPTKIAVNPDQRRRQCLLVAIFVVLATGVVLIGCSHYRNYKEQYRAEVERQLAAIAGLKVSELVQYRRERLGDGAILFQNAAHTGLVRHFLKTPPDAGAQRQLQVWLGKYATHYQYDQVHLLDAMGVTCLSAPGGLQSVPVTIVKGMAEVRLGIDQAIPCGLLVNELVSNALKHAFLEGRTGELRVELRPVAGGPEVCLRVADNGVGLPADFDLGRLKSLGLSLVPDLARQIGGRLAIGPGPGASFAVTFAPAAP